jgi:hypothetical protein
LAISVLNSATSDSSEMVFKMVDCIVLLFVCTPLDS